MAGVSATTFEMKSMVAKGPIPPRTPTRRWELAAAVAGVAADETAVAVAGLAADENAAAVVAVMRESAEATPVAATGPSPWGGLLIGGV